MKLNKLSDSNSANHQPTDSLARTSSKKSNLLRWNPADVQNEPVLLNTRPVMKPRTPYISTNPNEQNLGVIPTDLRETLGRSRRQNRASYELRTPADKRRSCALEDHSRPKALESW